MSWKDKKIVIMGDSITWGAYTDGNIWWQELGRLLGCDSVVGNGVPGSCFSVTSDYGPINDPMSERWKCLPTGAVMGKSPYTVDGLHPNTEGHLKLAERIFPYIAKVI